MRYFAFKILMEILLIIQLDSKLFTKKKIRYWTEIVSKFPTPLDNKLNVHVPRRKSNGQDTRKIFRGNRMAKKEKEAKVEK